MTEIDGVTRCYYNEPNVFGMDKNTICQSTTTCSLFPKASQELNFVLYIYIYIYCYGFVLLLGFFLLSLFLVLQVTRAHGDTASLKTVADR